MSETANDSNPTESATSTASEPRTASMPGWLIPALLVVGVLFGLLGELIVGAVAAPGAPRQMQTTDDDRFGRIFYPEPHGQLGDPPEWLAQVRSDMIKNNAIGYGAFGALLLGAIGALIGLGYSTSNPIKGLILGGLAGLLAGAISPISYFIENQTYEVDMEGAIKAAAILGLTFVGLGLAGAFTGICLTPGGSASKAIVNGIVAAIIGLVAYVLISIAAFPIGFPESVYPLDSGVRYTLFVCLGICPAIAAIMTLRGSAVKEAK